MANRRLTVAERNAREFFNRPQNSVPGDWTHFTFQVVWSKGACWSAQCRTLGGDAISYRAGGGGYDKTSSTLADALRFLPGLTDGQRREIDATRAAGIEANMRACLAAGWDLVVIGGHGYGPDRVRNVFVWRVGTLPPMLWGTASAALWAPRVGGEG